MRVKVICADDCGNAPRKLLLRDLQTAWVHGEVEAVAEHMSDDIVFDVVGRERIVGKEAFRTALDRMAGAGPAVELHIHNIITHGRTAALNGTVTMANGRRYGFCDVYGFAGAGRDAKITEIASYVLSLEA
jgi:predicted ester cyclase